MKSKKGFIATLLLLTILLIAGRHVFFISYMKSQKMQFRTENFKNNLSKTKVIEVALDDLFEDKNGLVWKEHNKEVILENKYHEVVFIQKKEKKALVFILEDEEENHLFESFFSIHKSKTNFFADLIKIISQLTFIDRTQQTLNINFSYLKTEVINPLFNLQNFQTQLIKPPKALFQL